MQTITEFLSDSPHPEGVLEDDFIPLLQELDAQLVENTYIDIVLLNKIYAAIGRNKSPEYQKLADYLIRYDYPKARHILANILKNLAT